MLHACLLPITLCFYCASWCFYGFSVTNILTRCHSASSLFSAVFDSRKVTKEIFSELDETWRKSLFYPKVPEARRRGPGGAQGAHTLARRGWPLGRAWARCGHPGPPPAPPFRLYIPPEAKTLKISPNPPEKFRRRRHIEAKFRGTEVSVPAPCRDGEVPPEGSPSTPPPSSSPLLTPMMRSE